MGLRGVIRVISHVIFCYNGEDYTKK